MKTNDEIIEEINDERIKQQFLGGMVMLPTDPRAENYKDLIKAMDKARADERAKIKKIIQDYIYGIDIKTSKSDCDKITINLLIAILKMIG